MDKDVAQSEAGGELPPSAPAPRSRLLYTLSLPERVLRGTSAAVGGLARETTGLLIPRAFADSRTYRVMLGQTLDFLVHDVGGVKKDVEPTVDGDAARRAAGSFMDLAGVATLHISPLTWLAVFSDLAHGSHTLIQEWAAELREQGVIAEDSTVGNVEDLLAAIKQTANTSNGAFETPPLSVEGLKELVAETKRSLSAMSPDQILPRAEAQRLWSEMREMADSNGLDLVQLSGAMSLYGLNKLQVATRGALSTVRVAARVADRTVVDHYQQVLGELRERGIYSTLRESSAPYADALWQNFAPHQATITERVVNGELPRAGLDAVRRWWRGRQTPAPPVAESDEPPAADEGPPAL